MNDHHSQGSENRKYRNASSKATAVAVITPECLITPLHEVTVARLRPTWGEVVATYLSAAIDSDGTRRAYARHLKNAGQLFGTEYLDEVTGADLIEFRKAVMDADLAPASQAQALSALRSFLTWSGSMDQHAIAAQVISLALRTPRVSVQVRYSVLNEREARAILNSARGERERAILGVLLGAGLRVAEAANLAVSDVVEDLDGGVSLFVRQGKGRKDRIVPIGADVDAFIRTYLVASSRYLGGEGPLFLATDRGVKSRTNKGLTTRAIAKMVAETALEAGIVAKRVSPHALRHTFAIRCLRAGGNVIAVSKLMGHSTPVMTFRYLDHLATSELRATVPALPLGGVDDTAA